MPEQSNDYRVVVFGAGGVGKTSLVLRFINGTFRNSYIPTIEDTYRKVISSNKSICTLQITDTTGSHQFPAMQRLSISKGHAFILVYSISSRQSLEELRTILELVNEQMWKCKYIETSAKNDTNVTELFEELLKLETSRQLSLQPIEETESKGGVQKMKEKCVLM
ncbi:GTP-binding protein Di-Ras2 isoform X2 [Lepeophtheirus salmonis]|uniref:GTP-binding protein Di-Ras2 isoform X2 n=1 Tax=Lepeophtheirus salmonis TaxID=72036 RepID=UPI003AF3D3AD